MMDGRGPANAKLFRSPEPVLRAKSVAIVGATDHAPGPKAVFDNLRAYGFAGAVYPVNPRYREIWGVACYPDFAALPAPADLAIVDIPSDGVLESLREAALHGLRSAVVLAAGPHAGSDPGAGEWGDALAALCAETGLRLCGPGSAGVASLHDGLLAFPDAALRRLEPGPVGLVFQSGGALTPWVEAASARGIRFGAIVASGGEVDLTLGDYVDFLVDDPDTAVIVLSIADIGRPDRLMAAAASALRAGKPILALKAGRVARAGAAETTQGPVMADAFAAYLAMCERYGIVNCATYEDLTETTLAFQPGRLPAGRRIGVVTTGGGVVELVRDYVAEFGAALPPLSRSTIERIRTLAAPGADIANPLDAGRGARFTPETAAAICTAVAQDPAIDMVACTLRLPDGADGDADPQPLGALARSTDKPVVAFERAAYPVSDAGRAFQQRAGIPFLQGLRPAIGALSWLGFYGERAGGTVPALPEPLGRAGDVEPGSLHTALEGFGIAQPQGGFAETPERAAQVAEVIGFPVALKVVSPEVSHKYVAGGVKLNLRNTDEVEQATIEMGLAITAGGATLAGFVVQEMVNGVEMLAAVQDDPRYGPLITVGTGGILTELMTDVAVRLLPVAEDDVCAMLAELRAEKLLAGYRGQPPADTDALVAAVCGLSDFYLDHRHRLAACEINPLTVLTTGNGVRAVDLRASYRKM